MSTDHNADRTAGRAAAVLALLTVTALGLLALAVVFGALR